MTSLPIKKQLQRKGRNQLQKLEYPSEVDQTNENHSRHALSWGVFSILGKRASTG